MRRLFTSESVTEGHPDKICDTISDSVLDELLAADPDSRVACETCVATGFVLVMGEITTEAYVDIEAVARKAIKDIGYNSRELGFDSASCSVMTMIHNQSADIALGVDKALEAKDKKNTDKYNLVGAGDQGLMFGYACNETPSLMPLPISLAHALTKRLTFVRKQGILPYLRPDGKSQVTVEYENDLPVRIDTVVVSAQHEEGVDLVKLKSDILQSVILATLPQNLVDSNTKFFINPTGKFVIGGPNGDTGLTGRKIIADTYGGYCAHGGGAFSGKDATKVDRSASYMARYASKNIVAASLAQKCEIQVSYAIGVAKPVSMYVNTYGTGKLPDEKLSQIVAEEFDFRPAAIIDKLQLKRPIYKSTTNYGHFGKDGLSWEAVDLVERLRKYL